MTMERAAQAKYLASIGYEAKDIAEMLEFDYNNVRHIIADRMWEHVLPCTIKDLTIEIWRDVPEFEDCYQVSNFGRVRSLSRYLHDKNNNFKKVKGIFLKPCLRGKGYEQVTLQLNGYKKIYFVHKLVAEVFVDNPHNLKRVAHINGDRVDNSAGNLMWHGRK